MLLLNIRQIFERINSGNVVQVKKIVYKNFILLEIFNEHNNVFLTNAITA